jgi:hypothetical protein
MRSHYTTIKTGTKSGRSGDTTQYRLQNMGVSPTFSLSHPPKILALKISGGPVLISVASSGNSCVPVLFAS